MRNGKYVIASRDDLDLPPNDREDIEFLESINADTELSKKQNHLLLTRNSVYLRSEK